tara:strand:+ start:872 stop:2047 length:1176 start_codon:yes stop_codon:yes gene_type:complete
MKDIKIKWHKSIQEIPKIIWNNFLELKPSPFYKWDWLNALERSGSVSPKYGWQPLFLSAWLKNDLIACAPLYLKSHSYGEFIFDNAFAQLAQDMGLKYYPKLIGMSPLSPIEGYRFLFAEGMNQKEITQLLISEIDLFAKQNGILSCNFLYVDPEWMMIAESLNCAKWVNQQSVLKFNEEKNFSDFLNKFNSNQRRNIKKERERIKKCGITIETLSGSQINKMNLTKMHYYYQLHCSRWGIWGSKYLTESFFVKLASKELNENIIIFEAKGKDNTIGMSLCVKDKNMLWGRYWGAEKNVNCLHFEACYYSPIEWAIKNKIKYFDPGAGGGQKKRRGFITKPNASLHRWYNLPMDSLIREWLPKANKLMLNQINATNNEVPFKFEEPKLSDT